MEKPQKEGDNDTRTWNLQISTIYSKCVAELIQN